MIAYKLFRCRNGKLYPLYIDTENNVPLKVILHAKPGQLTANGKVKSKLGELAFRPGWHCCEIPFADHIGKRQPNGELYQRKDHVWCEVEVPGEIDYTEMAKAGKTNSRDAYLKTVPTNGYYWYQTNPNAKVRWLISGEIKVNKILTNEEVADLCHKAGFEPQKISER